MVMTAVEALMEEAVAVAMAEEEAAMEEALQVSNPRLLTTPNYYLLPIG